MTRGRRKRKIEEMLELTGLNAEAAKLPLKGYSKGMNQRIGLAQALLNDPDIVFLDEPQSGLDPLGRKEIRDIILRLREQGKTVFFSSHILSDAEMICDRVAILVKGELKNVGALSQLLSARVKEYEIVLSAVPKETVERFRPKALRVLESPGEAMFLVKEEDLAHEVVREALAGGGRLVSFSPRRETLEEYFISQVAPGAPEAAGAAQGGLA